MALPPYTIGFYRKDGCPWGIIEDMARFDAAHIKSVTLVSGDVFTFGEDGAPPPVEVLQSNAREVTFQPKHRGYLLPTMPRWASFALGAFLHDPNHLEVKP